MVLGSPAATSRERFGPDSAAIGRPGSRAPSPRPRSPAAGHAQPARDLDALARGQQGRGCPDVCCHCVDVRAHRLRGHGEAHEVCALQRSRVATDVQGGREGDARQPPAMLSIRRQRLGLLGRAGEQGDGQSCPCEQYGERGAPGGGADNGRGAKSVCGCAGSVGHVWPAARRVPPCPIFGSVPARSRRRLPRWPTSTATVTTTPKIRYSGSNQPRET